jgi:hypothetical protein
VPPEMIVSMFGATIARDHVGAVIEMQHVTAIGVVADQRSTQNYDRQIHLF